MSGSDRVYVLAVQSKSIIQDNARESECKCWSNMFFDILYPMMVCVKIASEASFQESGKLFFFFLRRLAFGNQNVGVVNYLTRKKIFKGNDNCILKLICFKFSYIVVLSLLSSFKNETEGCLRNFPP